MNGGNTVAYNMSTPGNPCIVLDLDQTLIDSDNDRNITTRPFLAEFLKFCFENFAKVAIWTAATAEWYDYVYKTTLRPILRAISEDDGGCYLSNRRREYRFAFVHTREHCDEIYSLIGKGPVLTKPLSKIFMNFTGEYAAFQYNNTLIVDDNAYACIKNVNNSVLIPEFRIANETTDTHLISLMLVLELLLKQFQTYGRISGDKPDRFLNLNSINL